MEEWTNLARVSNSNRVNEGTDSQEVFGERKKRVKAH